MAAEETRSCRFSLLSGSELPILAERGVQESLCEEKMFLLFITIYSSGFIY